MHILEKHTWIHKEQNAHLYLQNYDDRCEWINHNISCWCKWMWKGMFQSFSQLLNFKNKCILKIIKLTLNSFCNYIPCHENIRHENARYLTNMQHWLITDNYWTRRQTETLMHPRQLFNEPYYIWLSTWVLITIPWLSRNTLPFKRLYAVNRNVLLIFSLSSFKQVDSKLIENSSNFVEEMSHCKQKNYYHYFDYS